MNIDSIAAVLLALVVVGLLMWRQLPWRTFDPARALRLPIVLGAVGLLQLANLHGTRLTAIDGTLLGLELLLSLGIGAVMGASRRSARLRTDPVRCRWAAVARGPGCGSC